MEENKNEVNNESNQLTTLKDIVKELSTKTTQKDALLKSTTENINAIQIKANTLATFVASQAMYTILTKEIERKELNLQDLAKEEGYSILGKNKAAEILFLCGAGP